MSTEWETPEEEAERLFKPHYWAWIAIIAVFILGVWALS